MNYNLFDNSKKINLIAGPCVLESYDHAMFMCEKLVTLADKLQINLIYKSSFDKANRSSLSSDRGLGLENSLSIFQKVKDHFNVSLITDVHESAQCKDVAEVVDILQIPAFLCRQTDLLLAAGNTGKIINVKKGQFLAPWDMQHVVNKLISTGNEQILLCERGTSFGYNNLVVDMTSLPIMANLGYPVVFDATHAVQSPGNLNGKTGGRRDMVPFLAKAAVATGISTLFIETHDNPDHAPSDAANMLPLDEVHGLLTDLLAIDKIVKTY